MKKRTIIYEYLKNIKYSIRRNIDNLISKKNSRNKKKPVIEIKSIDLSNSSIDFNINDEVKDLLKSDEWEEVNQGLEILASLQQVKLNTLCKELIQEEIQFNELISLINYLGISKIHLINVAFKLLGLTRSLDKLKRLTINSIDYVDGINADLDLIKLAEQIESIVINLDQNKENNLTNISSINKLVGIKSLVIDMYGIEEESDDISKMFLPLVNLEYLTVKNWPFLDLEPLSNNKNLKYLSIAEGSLEKVVGINKLVSLRKVHFLNIYSLSSIQTINSCENISQITIKDCNEISAASIEDVFSLRYLEDLSLERSYSSEIDLFNIKNCKNLNSLRLEGTGFKNIGSLAECEKLSKLNIDSSYQFKLKNKENEEEIYIDKFEHLKKWMVNPKNNQKYNSIGYPNKENLTLSLLKINILEFLTGNASQEIFSQRFKLLLTRISKSRKEILFRSFLLLDDKVMLPLSHPIKKIVLNIKPDKKCEDDLLEIIKVNIQLNN